MREKMAILGGAYGKRYTAKQKNRFINYLNQQLYKQGYETRLDVKKGGTGRVCKNLYAGDLEKAKVIVTVPYDTPARFFFPGYVYHPLDNKKTLHIEMLYQGLQSAAAVSLLILYYFFIFQPCRNSGNTINLLMGVWGLILFAFGSYKAAVGTANPYNFDRNTAGIVILMEVMRKLGRRRQVAYAFLDQAVCSKEGYMQLAQEMGKKIKDIQFFMLECASAGEELHFITRQMIQVNREGIRVHCLNETEGKGSILELFPQGALLAGGEWDHGELIVKNTRTDKDSELHEEKMEYTVTFLRQYLERLCK